MLKGKFCVLKALDFVKTGFFHSISNPAIK